MLLKQPLHFRLRRTARWLRRVPGALLLLPLLPLLVLSLIGCATNCPDPTPVSPKLPTLPSVTTPLPQTPYSLIAADSIKTWRQKLMAMPLMSEPSSKPGPKE